MVKLNHRHIKCKKIVQFQTVLYQVEVLFKYFIYFVIYW